MNPTAQREIEHHKPLVDDTLSICVLDDELPVVGMLEGMIEGFGHSAFGTSDPQEALELIGKRACRVVLCDVKMPAMNGLAFLDLALQRDPGVYVILMTGYYTIE